MSASAPPPLSARAVSSADAGAVAALLGEYDAVYLDEVTDRLSAADVRDGWRSLDLERDSVAVQTPAGAVVAVGFLEDRGEGVLELDGYVRPRWAGNGLGGFLVAWAEERAAERGSRVLRTPTLVRDEAAARLLAARGFRPVRRFYRMLVDLDSPPPEPVWPAGFAVATLQPGDERVLHAVVEESFAEEWGRYRRTFEEWAARVLAAESFDPTLVFLVRDADEVVAAELCSRSYGIGWVGTLGVRPAWRRRGLGRALLLHAFGELYRRGERRIGLGVDAANPTGATRLYESLGMRVVWQADVHEKAL